MTAYDKIVRTETIVSILERWLAYIVYEDNGERQDGGACKIAFAAHVSALTLESLLLGAR